MLPDPLWVFLNELKLHEALGFFSKAGRMALQLPNPGNSLNIFTVSLRDLLPCWTHTVYDWLLQGGLGELQGLLADHPPAPTR